MAAILAGVWEYNFSVDGVTLIDPGNPAIKPMRERRASILHVAGSPPQPWDFQDVPQGTVHQHSYLSKVLNRPQEVWVYTPPGYETGAAGKYLLLVLQHGSGDSHQTRVTYGKAHWILDNLIATGKARPMVVVMLDGHPFSTAAQVCAPAHNASNESSPKPSSRHCSSTVMRRPGCQRLTS